MHHVLYFSPYKTVLIVTKITMLMKVGADPLAHEGLQQFGGGGQQGDGAEVLWLSSSARALG